MLNVHKPKIELITVMCEEHDERKGFSVTVVRQGVVGTVAFCGYMHRDLFRALVSDFVNPDDMVGNNFEVVRSA